MSWLILGSNSFSGASFIAHLMKQEVNVIGVSRSIEVAEPFKPYCWDALEKKQNVFEFHQIDINQDLETLQDLIISKKPKVIVNFAAQSMVGQSWDRPRDWFATNAASFSTLVKFLSQLDFLDKYLHFSTPEVYGSTEGSISEDTPFNPTTPYAISRAAGDYLVRAFRDHYGLPAIITRASNVYGPGQQLYRLIPKVIYQAINNEKFILDGGGLSDRDFIHIDDVNTALLEILNSGTDKTEFHISTGNQILIKNLVHLLSEELGVPFEEFVELGPDRIGKDKSYYLSSKTLLNNTSWRPRISLQTGLAQVVEWVVKYNDVLAQYPLSYVHKR